jgi:hypothetical protein
MKSIATILFLFILTNLVVAQENEAELIRKNFDSYKAFLYNGNGGEVANLIDSQTIKYYGDIIELVKNADSLKVESLSLLDKITVLLVRQSVSKENILTFDGKALLIHAINNGMIDKTSARSFTIGDITVDNNFAKGQIIANGTASPLFLNFYKENGQWKFDLTSLFPIGIPALQKLEKELGERGFIDAMLSAGNGNKQSQNVWRPIR